MHHRVFFTALTRDIAPVCRSSIHVRAPMRIIVSAKVGRGKGGSEGHLHETTRGQRLCFVLWAIPTLLSFLSAPPCVVLCRGDRGSDSKRVTWGRLRGMSRYDGTIRSHASFTRFPTMTRQMHISGAEFRNSGTQHDSTATGVRSFSHDNHDVQWR